VCDVDVLGGLNIKKHYGDRALSVFIQPPSIDELRNRLISRGTDELSVIEDRIARAEFELSHASQFDVVIVNDNLETALAEALKKVQTFVQA
jgi:guanylate kinase